MFWMPTIRVDTFRWVQWEEKRFPNAHGNLFTSILTGTPRNIRLPWKPRNSCMYIKYTCFLYETFDVSDGIIRWFLNVGCFFTLLIAGYSWTRRPPRSPWYPRMQRDKGKFKTETFLPLCLFTWLCILRSQAKLFSCHHCKAACLNTFFMWLRNAVFPYLMFKNDIITTFSFGQFYSKIALNIVFLTYNLLLNQTRKCCS